jgi:isocitrate/isopropylmalate dehydrogenase
MMLDHLGENSAAQRITDAVLAVQDQMAIDDSTWTTTSVGDAVAGRV